MQLLEQLSSRSGERSFDLIPFGLRFREKVGLGGGEAGITATATGEITWLDTGVDHDG